MKPPPFLLGAALLFWGWQSEFLIVGAVLAVVLESARFIKTRWEFSEEDFSRVWTFCALLFLAAAVYGFTANDGPARFSGFLQNPNIRTQAGAGLSTARTGTALLRWLPMIFFPFIAAQMFSTREAIPLRMISLILRRRWKKARQTGQTMPPSRDVNVGYHYFAATMLAASVHPTEGNSFFWGLCVLLTWALWAQRSRRFAFVVWLGALALAITLGFYGQRSVGQLQRYIENINPQWFARFMRRGFGFDPTQSSTALGNVGEIKTSGKIVIRLEPKNGARAPTYLREASYRSYRQQIWFAGTSKDDFIGIPEEMPNNGVWHLLPGKTNTATVNIACYLEGSKGGSPAGLLPLPTGSSRLEKLQTYLPLEKNSAGAVLAQAPRLVRFDASFGPGATIDSTPDTDEDLSVPEKEEEALDQVIAELQLRGKDPEQTMRAVAGFFADQFTYSTWQGVARVRRTNETALSRFLLNTRSGHCEYFATATVLLLRRLEIPARYAVGYAVHESSGNKYVVRLRDAHAWCLAWNEDKQIWQDFDTTPGSWVEAESKNKSRFQWLSDFWSRIGFEFSKLRWGQSQLRQYLLLIVVPALALLLYRILFRRGRQKKRSKASEEEWFPDWPGLDSEFYQLEKRLADHGVPRGPSEPVSDWLERVAATTELAELRAPLQELLRLHYRYRFDPLGLSEADREALKREARACLEKLARADRPAVHVAS